MALLPFGVVILNLHIYIEAGGVQAALHLQLSIATQHKINLIMNEKIFFREIKVYDLYLEEAKG